MSFSHTQGTGTQPATSPSHRDRGFLGSSRPRSLLNRPLKSYKTNGRKDFLSSGPTKSVPLGENVNGLKNGAYQNPTRGDKNYQDIYTFRETSSLQNGTLTTPEKSRRTGNAPTTPSRTPSGTRAKRKRVATIETSDSEEMVTAVEGLVGTAKGPINGAQSSRHEDQRPNGVPLRQASGLFAPKPPMSNNRLSEEEFDSLIYGQTDAHRPSLGSLFERSGPTRQQGGTSMSGGRPRRAAPCLHIRMDPRIHWTHPRSEEWHKKKQEEIEILGTRKENCGKAAERMQAKRLREALVRNAIPAMAAKNDAGSHDFGRAMDFGDVPEAELPEMVQSNPEWLRATAWMRKCRGKSLERQREIERRKKAGLPWKGLLGASGIK